MADLVLYGTHMSPFVRKVEAVLFEKKLEFDFEEVNVFALPDWYRTINPLGRIPTLRDRTVGGQGVQGTLPDSSAICAYLERKHPSPPLMPDDPYAYGRTIWLEEFSDSGLAAAGGFGIFRAVMVPRFAGKEPDLKTARETWNEKLPRHYDYLESVLDGAPYFVGTDCTLADIAVAAQMIQVDLVAGPPDAARWPSLVAHLERMKQRPCFQANLKFCTETIAKVLPDKIDLS